MMIEQERKRDNRVLGLWMFFFAILGVIIWYSYQVNRCLSTGGKWDPKTRICETIPKPTGELIREK